MNKLLALAFMGLILASAVMADGGSGSGDSSSGSNDQPKPYDGDGGDHDGHDGEDGGKVEHQERETNFELSEKRSSRVPAFGRLLCGLLHARLPIWPWCV